MPWRTPTPQRVEYERDLREPFIRRKQRMTQASTTCAYVLVHLGEQAHVMTHYGRKPRKFTSLREAQHVAIARENLTGVPYEPLPADDPRVQALLTTL